jgi:predicted nucleotidyltransferase
MNLSRFHEGYYIRTVEGLFFAVKGSRHSDDLVVATLRYVPDEDGERVLGGERFRRVYDTKTTSEYLRTNYPHFINYINWLGTELQSVPVSQIAEVYKPADKLKHILKNPRTSLENRIAGFVEALSKASGVSANYFGVSGSVLIGLENEGSDIDLNVYGKQEGQMVYYALKRLRSETDWVVGYDSESIEPVLVSRWGDTGLDLDKLRALECNKVLHGMVFDVDYFIRLLLDENEYDSVPLETVSISATITDASDSIYTPCTYRVNNVTIKGKQDYDIIELKSYRGKFTEQAQKDDEIIARGTVERVKAGDNPYYRLILGKKGDYLVSA